ncbi:hypothetical protein C5Y96_05100 [Blastopirellula marina]|uniref:DUF7691 domain-containing protein n=1 Tax=Blastopirellula marina TaxID=124 RepID=A0A2S8G472_9BACT|nr:MULTISPECIES: hypothetical protein [Pirellulaceae]PQO39237.1 hypothetical protein C5Y96_05100 [Blastopirellula marina]RCS55545.1 hypothetical protein DTL36_05110 [Bremerella cremea]
MSYCHMFYAVDLDQLRRIAGSQDRELYDRIAAECDSLDGAEKSALKRIIQGRCEHKEGDEYLYGYALKALCEHIGEMIGDDVAAIRDHPYQSKLIANGPPIDIPYTTDDFPEIGYLAPDQLQQEYDLATKTRPKAKWTLVGFMLRKLSGGVIGREPNAEEIAEDMQAYAETLKECLDKQRGLVSFRH